MTMGINLKIEKCRVEAALEDREREEWMEGGGQRTSGGTQPNGHVRVTS